MFSGIELRDSDWLIEFNLSRNGLLRINIHSVRRDETFLGVRLIVIRFLLVIFVVNFSTKDSESIYLMHLLIRWQPYP